MSPHAPNGLYHAAAQTGPSHEHDPKKCGSFCQIRRTPHEGQADTEESDHNYHCIFDFYGDLLTERQKEFYDLYYNEDLSLAEIAENYGISRQGVRDVIVRAEAAMTEVEDKTHLIRRFYQMQKEITAVEEAADRLLKAVDEHSYTDRMLYETALTIKEYTAKLKQE